MTRKRSKGDKTAALAGTTPEQVFPGTGEMAALMREKDWSRTPLGPVETWSPSLRMMVKLLLANRFPLLLWWGPAFCQIYNDPYCPVLGTKHPKPLGQPAGECWSEIWDTIGPLIESPFNGGPATWMDDIFLEPNRYGFVEETHFTIAYSPVPDDTAPGQIGGVLATVHEITEKVVGERRVVALRDLGARVAEAKTAEDACQVAANTLAQHAKDVPFALLYLINPNGTRAHLAAAAGVDMGTPFSPLSIELDETIDRTEQAVWPLARAVHSEAMQMVNDLAERFERVPEGPWSDTPHSAAVMCIPSNIAHRPAGLLVAGISPRLRFDDAYAGFLVLVSSQVATAIANARAYEDERRRAEALEEIDRAKTVFFSNVSHEFRTPLTLMLGPLEDLLSGNHLLPQAHSQVEMVHRNGLRLLKLVNTLLDFSRIEAGRAQAVYVPTDLTALTVDLASTFRSIVERAGLRLVVNCLPLGEPVYVDHDMWEKIVLNLLSNAFKFTFAGEIAVSLGRTSPPVPLRREEGTQIPGEESQTPPSQSGKETGGVGVELRVHDTGTGIPPEMPRLFERFHRVRDAASRTHEGSGIGLALVRDLVQLHGGTIRAESQPGEGTTFIVTLPLGIAHLPANRIEVRRTATATALGAAPFVEEAQRWLPDDAQVAVLDDTIGWTRDEALPAPRAAPEGPSARILLADDNSDLRTYLRRLLGERYTVEAVSNGARALAAARERPPDLVLSDVMMPELDGFALLHALREDPRTRDIPVILLSARAGEEAIIEGLAAGADDYLIKPFSAREVLARVASHLEIARLRHETAARADEMEAALAAMTDGVAVYDATGQLTRTNAALRRLIGIRDGDETAYAAIPTDERMRSFQPRDEQGRSAPAGIGRVQERVMAGEVLVGTNTIDRVYRARDGREHVVNIAGAPVRNAQGQVSGGVLVVRDMTERRQLEQRTLEALSALLDITRALVSAPEVAAAANGAGNPSGVEDYILELVRRMLPVRYVSLFTVTPDTEALELRALAGYTREQEALVRRRNAGQSLGERLANAGVRDRLMAGETVVLDLRDPVYAEQMRLYGASQAVIVPVRVGERFVGTLGLNPLEQTTLTPRDLTLAEGVGQMAALVIERDRLLRERAETAARNFALTETNQRMSEFLSIASHELRTPLTSMSVHVQMAERGLRALVAEDGYALPGNMGIRLQRMRDMLQRTDRQMKRLERLIADLLDVSRIAAGKLEMRTARCDLRDIVREAVEEQQDTWPARAIMLDLPQPAPLVVEADADRIGQVVTNYLTNALKYSDSDQPVLVDVRIRGVRVRVAVRDHGPGLTRAQREHLWEEFYRVPEVVSLSGSGVGLGLGLYLCRTIVERHGGQVGVESAPGEGSSFWFTLPLTEGISPDGHIDEG